MTNFLIAVPLFCVGLFLGMLVFIDIGRRIGARQRRADPDGAHLGVGVVDGAVFTLLALIVAFTFSGAASRFDDRRHLVVEEANDIGTAWLRIDLLPAATQPAVRDLFRQYLDSRLAMYRKISEGDAGRAEFARSVKLQQEIWAQAVSAARDSGSQPAHMLLLPAVNAMIDITTTRAAATQMHPPTIIFVMLAALALAGSMLVGYSVAGGKTRSWLHVVSFAFVMAATVYVILDIEYPRLGLIRVDAIDQVLVDLRQSMD